MKTTPRENYPMAFKGKRIIVFWTTDAYNRGSEWPSFLCIDESDEGLWCQGVDSPDGGIHDGTKTFIDFKSTLDIIEWI